MLCIQLIGSPLRNETLIPKLIWILALDIVLSHVVQSRIGISVLAKGALPFLMP